MCSSDVKIRTTQAREALTLNVTLKNQEELHLEHMHIWLGNKTLRKLGRGDTLKPMISGPGGGTTEYRGRKYLKFPLN